MSLLNQKTLKNPIQFKGVGLHNGKLANVCIKPAPVDSGIVFKRVDLKTNNLVYPSFLNVSNTSLNTTISNEYGVQVSTIEHLMGALFSLGIDNALIEIDNMKYQYLMVLQKNLLKNYQKLTLKSAIDQSRLLKLIKKLNIKMVKNLFQLSLPN